MAARDFDVVVFGATGFTGKMAAEYLLNTYGVDGELRWAIAGRSQKKLEKVKAGLAEVTGEDAAQDIPVLVADSGDKASLDAMCQRTKAVVSTVGPFLKYGEPLVAACVRNGTDYCDSTGETTWIKRMISKYGEEAVAKGVRLVPSCGYDSIPIDLAVFTLVQGIREAAPEADIKEVTHYVGPMRGGTSGGTAHTAMNIMGSEDKKLLMEVYGNPLSLVPKGAPAGKAGGDQRLVRWSEPAGAYTAPFPMAMGNERLVHRSAALNDYGPSFTVREVLALQSVVKAWAVAIVMALGSILAMLPPVRWLLKEYVLPAPGEGPSRRNMDKGFGISSVHTKAGRKHYVVQCNISKGDVGYKSTGMMLAESAIALARSQDRAVAGDSHASGFLTPASCPGLQSDLVEALGDKCGISFTFSEHSSSSSARPHILSMDTKPPKALMQ